MGSYDYSHYFQAIISNQHTLLIYLQVFIFLFGIYFIWEFMSKAIRGRY